MKKIIFSLIAIVAVAAMAGFGTYAVWVDDETAAGNSITADQMDLVLVSAPITISDVVPGENGDSSAAPLTISNQSNTVTGTLTFAISGLVNAENVCAEPEYTEGGEVLATCAATGELGAYTNLTVHVDTNADGVADFSSAADTINNLAAAGQVAIGGATLAPMGAASVWVEYDVIDFDTYPTQPNSNIYMTDSSSFDIDLRLTQN